MRKLARTTVLLVAILVLAVWSWGCNKNTSNNTNPTGQQGFGPQPGGPPGRMPPDGPGGPRGQGGFGSPLKQNMMRMFGRNPQALKNALETSLNADVPAWDTIQTQTGELVKLSGSIIKGEPPRAPRNPGTSLPAPYRPCAGILTWLLRPRIWLVFALPAKKSASRARNVTTSTKAEARAALVLPVPVVQAVLPVQGVLVLPEQVP